MPPPLAPFFPPQKPPAKPGMKVDLRNNFSTLNLDGTYSQVDPSTLPIAQDGPNRTLVFTTTALVDMTPEFTATARIGDKLVIYPNGIHSITRA